MIANFDDKMGIYYGVISQHSIAPEALDDIYFSPHSRDLNYESALKDFLVELQAFLGEHLSESSVESLLESAEEEFGYSYQNDEIDPTYDDGEYKITKCLDSDLMILKSKYVTWANPCSPCVPNAGNLNDAADSYQDHVEDTNQTPFTKAWPYIAQQTSNSQGSARLTYCLDSSWFDDEKAPYPYHEIDDEGKFVGDWIFPN